MTAGLRTFFLFCLLALSGRASASTSSAQLEGRVLDPDGRPVPRAEVIIATTASLPQRIVADSDGRFSVSGLAAGHYEVSASAPGLVADPIGIDLADGANASTDLSLRVSAVTEALVVSASQIDQPLSRTPDSVTVIAGREIEARQQFTLGAALESVPGLTIQRNGGPGTVTSLFTRGGESDFTLVLIDGVRANAFGGGIDLSQIPLQDVERIEVVRGPQSALFGSDAIGGVVQVITRTGGRPSAQLQVEGGSRAMRRVAASTTGELNNLRWQLGGNYVEDDGFTGRAANGQTVSNDDAREAQGSASLGWRRAASGGDLQGQWLYTDTERGAPGAYGSDPAARFSGVDRIARGTSRRIGGGARWVRPWFGPSSRVRQRVEVDAADYDSTFKSAFGTSDGESHRTHTRVQTDVAASARVGFSGGLEWLGERGGSTFIVAGAQGRVPVKRSVLGLFGEGRWNPHGRATITAGVRGERIHRDRLPGAPSAFSPRPDFPADTVVSVNPKIAAAVLVGGESPGQGGRSWTRLHGAVGTGIRPPDAFEIAFTDNSGLKPERSQSGELGVTQGLITGKVQLDATAFINSYDDLIVSVGRSFSGSSRYRTDNISNARARGLETSAAWRVASGLGLRASYTLLDTEILAVDGSPSAPPPYQVGDALPRRPRHQGAIDATWTRSRASAFVQVFIRGEALDVEPAFGPSGGLFPNPGRAVVNLGGAWRPARAVEVFARTLNLLDRDYEEVFGYPAPGRTAFVGARVAVGR
ncbi:MAG: TonB-dependent receptor [Vicinamibacterales bacterium]